MLNPNNIKKEFDPTSFNTQPKYHPSERIETSQIDQLTVWQSIIGNNVELNKSFTSPFRHDLTPGCNLKISTNNNIVFYDRPGRPFHAYNCFRAWMEINHVDFGTALRQIINKVPSCINVVRSSVTIEKIPIKYKPIYKRWSTEGKKFWSDYYVTDLSGIREVLGYETNNAIVKFQYLTFVYTYKYNIKNEKLPEDQWEYKFYTPKSESNPKSIWLGSVHKDKTWFIHNTDKLFFCKSAKCQKVLEVLYKKSYSWIHPQSEILSINYPHFDILAKYNKVIVLLDSDETGVLMSNKFCELLKEKNINYKQIFIEKYKDVSDMLHEVGIKETKKYLDFKLF